ncbi:MAG: metal ABC transporter ATP-binding protein [Christensenellaceae bacterium]|jgi:zinc transport system ATP-binding protein|nr:metal ABC transporter ATP-binding protein [Christensenellaceae bacterium]
MSFLHVKNITASYEEKKAVDNASFSINKGDYLCIVGENGSGKTTLMKVILGLIKPDYGKIEFDIVNRPRIGYLPQQTNVAKDFPASVEEVVLSGCVNSRKYLLFYNKSDKKLAEFNMIKLSILDLRHKSYNELSFGQQRRTLIARALCASSTLLVLDEPMNGLDSVSTKELYQLILDLNKDGMTIIMISHDLNNVFSQANKILHMNSKVVFFGSTEDYLKSKDKLHVAMHATGEL